MANDSLQLRGRVALVSGASRGIGRAVAKRLAESGCHVVINYRSDRDAAAEVVAHAEAQGVRAFAVEADVSEVWQAKRLVADTIQRFLRLDSLDLQCGNLGRCAC